MEEQTKNNKAMKIEEMIEVLNHFKNGGTVESTYKNKERWETVGLPKWNFAEREYRIVEEPKRVPYTYEDILTGKAIVQKNRKTRYLITSQDTDGIFTANGNFNCYKELLKDFTHTDGTPFGKLNQ